ncbi:hypothetical protein D3C85_1407470 [compost metagenome]
MCILHSCRIGRFCSGAGEINVFPIRRPCRGSFRNTCIGQVQCFIVLDVVYKNILFKITVGGKQQVFPIGRERWGGIRKGPDFVLYQGLTFQRFQVQQANLISAAQINGLCTCLIKSDIPVISIVFGQLLNPCFSIRSKGKPVLISFIGLVKKQGSVIRKPLYFHCTFR